MRCPAQLSFGGDFKCSLVYGGEHSVGKRKKARPIHTKKPMHITLRSSEAVGGRSFRRFANLKFIEELLPRIAKRWGITLYKQSINGNHIHLALRTLTRRGLQNFLRIISGQIARFVTGARRGKPFGKRFWDLPAFSRIAEWGNAFKALKRYVEQNVWETLGLIPYQKRNQKNP